MLRKIRVAVLCSGGGTNLQAILDAQAAGLSGREIGDALSALLREAVINPVLRDRARALAFLKKRADRL